MHHRQHLVFHVVIFLCALVGLTTGCSGEDCPINNVVAGKMRFYNHLGDAASINGTLSISVVRPQGDSIVLNQLYNASEVNFPLSYTHHTDTLIFDYNNGAVYDTLYVGHTNTPTLVSVACGTAMFHSITSVSSTHHIIDTLIVKSTEVNYDERENIQVIYRTDN